MTSRRIAVVDMGSNTLKFSVTEVGQDGSQRVIHAHAETVRLGAGVAGTGLIEPDRMERALLALRHYELIARSLDVDALIGVATAALRMARNGADLLDVIGHTTGWSVAVVSGDNEARLAFAGVAGSLPTSGTALIADIGGGSTELILAVDGARTGSQSLNVGSGTLADRCFRQDPPGFDAVMAAFQEATATLASSTLLAAPTAATVILTGGNGQFLESFARWSEVDLPFAPGRFGDLLRAIAKVHSDAVAQYLGIAPERARMLPAGAAIAHAIILLVRPQELLAVASGIRGGLVARWIADHPPAHGGPDV